jgi:hypothetical protein
VAALPWPLAAYRSPGCNGWQLEEVKKEILQYNKELKKKIWMLTSQDATGADVARITAPVEITLRQARIPYNRRFYGTSNQSVANRWSDLYILTSGS